MLDNYLEGKSPTIKMVILQEFTDELENIITIYKNVKLKEQLQENLEMKQVI